MQTLMNIREEEMFLYEAKTEGWAPENVREWLRRHGGSQCRADMLAQVWNHHGALLHDLADGECPADEYDEWDALLEELADSAVGSPTPQRDLILPFMERHGYVDSGGWWVSAHEGDLAYGREMPASFWVEVSREEQAEAVERLLAGREHTAHTNADEGFGYLYDGEVCIEIPRGEDEPVFVGLEGELTLYPGKSIGHTHYAEYQYDLQCFERDLAQALG